MGDLSPHFSRSEFRCRDGTPHPNLTVLLSLVAHLEVLRCLAGHKPLHVVSAFRTPTHNRAVGGATNSRHLYGDAVDLNQGYVRPDVARAAGFRGIGVKNGWCTHADLRPTPATWTYPS